MFPFVDIHLDTQSYTQGRESAKIDTQVLKKVLPKTWDAESFSLPSSHCSLVQACNVFIIRKKAKLFSFCLKTTTNQTGDEKG